jgi:hypothetical protein
VRGNLFDQEIHIKYEIENFKDKSLTLDIVEDLNRLAREYGADPHGDAEWVLGKETTGTVRITYEQGGARPVLHLRLPARPKDDSEKVEKQTFLFHLTIKNLW